MKNRIRSKAISAIAFVIFAKEERTRARRAEAYEAMIAESQAKIGPYVPQPCPKQIWA